MCVTCNIMTVRYSNFQQVAKVNFGKHMDHVEVNDSIELSTF